MSHRVKCKICSKDLPDLILIGGSILYRPSTGCWNKVDSEIVTICTTCANSIEKSDKIIVYDDIAFDISDAQRDALLDQLRKQRID